MGSCLRAVCHDADVPSLSTGAKPESANILLYLQESLSHKIALYYLHNTGPLQ